MPKFSVIVPVYNAEKYIEQCVCSLVNQKCKDYEIILVNDCSTDRSLELCNSFAKQYSNIVVTNQPQNRGVSAARNRGIEIAKGDYILFVDSDDFVSADYFETLETITAEGECDLVSFGHYDYLINGDGNVKTELSHMNYDVSCNDTSPWNKLFLKTFFASPCNKLFLKKTLLHYSIRFDESCVCYEDYLFNVEYCKHISTFKTTAKPLYYYRQFANVNHVCKRKWGERFLVSRKVAAKTDEIIASKSEIEDLRQIRRYIYSAYLVELEASKVFNNGYKDSLKKLLRDKNFINAVDSINPSGTKLALFKIFYKMHFTLGCKAIIESLL